MKLFTKEVDKQLFAQYPKGSDLDNQMVVAKIFNPYGRGVWYLLNSDPEDPDYIWAIVDLFEPEMGSVSRSELQTIKVPPFGLGLERDIYFTPKPAKEVFEGVLSGKRYAAGGMTPGRYYTDNSGNELRYVGESQGKLLFKDGEKIVSKSEEDFEDRPKETKLFGFFADGGRVKGRNNETGETYGVVIGSVKKSDENIEGGTEMNVRSGYSSRISEVKLVFDKNGNLYEITDFGYALEGNYPDTSTRSGGRIYNADKKETLEVLSKKYNPAFAKKLIELAKDSKMAHGGKTNSKRYTVNVYYGGEMEDEEVYTDSLEEAKRISQGGEHSEIYDNEKKEFVEIEYADGGEMGKNKFYVVSAKEDKVVSKGFDSEEEAKKEMYELYEKNKDFSLATRKMADGGEMDSDDDDIDYNSISDLQSERNRLVRWSNQYGSKGADYTIKKLEERIEYLKSKDNKMAKGGEVDTYEVELSAVPNPDYADEDDRGSINIKKSRKKVSDVEEARRVVREFIEENDLGSGNWPNGGVYKNGKKIGYISYNGRFWDDTKMAKGGEVDKPKTITFGELKQGEEYYQIDNTHYQIKKYKITEKRPNGYSMIQIGGANIGEQNKDGAIKSISKYQGAAYSSNEDVYLYKTKEDAKKSYKIAFLDALEKMAMGGKVKFEDKVKSIKASLLKRKKVSPKVQKDYGKTYSPKEAEESAKRIAASQRMKYELKKKFKKGGKTIAQTPAPKKDRVFGSSKNKAGSASSKKTASNIELNESIVKTLGEKAKEYNEKHSSKVSTSTLKAVMRRGMGAFSTSHRPGMTRQGWGYARVNKFLKKKGGAQVKAAYVQDDDLL